MSQVTTWVLAFQAPDYSCMVVCKCSWSDEYVLGQCVVPASAGIISPQFCFYSMCASVRGGGGSMWCHSPVAWCSAPAALIKVNRQVYWPAPGLTLCHWTLFIHKWELRLAQTHNQNNTPDKYLLTCRYYPTGHISADTLALWCIHRCVNGR